MKRLNEMLAVLLFIALAPTAFAQHTGHGGMPSGGGFGNTASDSSMRDFKRAVMLQATDDQRAAFAKCMEASERARKVADQMLGPGTNWDVNFLATQKEQLHVALAELGAAHQHFRHTLTRDQEKELAKYLGRLDRFNAELSSRMAHVDRELSTNKPDQRRLSSDTHKIREVTEKWVSEHQKIAKEMGIGG